MPDVVCLGEALIDFVATEEGASLEDTPGFHKRMGGAPANVAIGVSRLGVEAGFVGMVGDDPFGRFVTAELAEAGVDTSEVFNTSLAHTTLAFVSPRAEEDLEFMFYRDPGADELLTPRDVDEDYVGGARVFHFGSLTLTHPDARGATHRAVQYAGPADPIVAMDPNLRFSLWDSEEEMKGAVLEILPLCDLVKLSRAEALFLADEEDLSRAAKKIQEMGPRVVLATMGKEGCFYRGLNGEGQLGGFEVEAVDATGAGDAFSAGFYSYLIRGDHLEQFPSWKDDVLVEALRYANAVAAVTTTFLGATAAFPDPGQVEDFLDTKSQNGA